MTIWTVFTGDIVNSTALETAALDAIFDGLGAATRLIGGWQDRPAPFARFRGDGWQMAMPPQYTFRALMCLRAAVRAQGKGYDTRIGIGVGAGDLSENDLSRAEGDAFFASGRALDAMSRSVRMSAPEGPLALRAALPLADRIAQGWTQRQAEVMQGLIVPGVATQAEIARNLGISRQMAQRHADAASAEAILEVCALLEASNVN